MASIFLFSLTSPKEGTAIACLTSEKLSVLGVNNYSDESNDEKEEEWVTPSHEKSVFSVFEYMEQNLNVVCIFTF